MLSNLQIKFIRSLQQKKYRKLHSSFVAEGDKIVGELLKGPFTINHICALEPWLDAHQHEIPGSVQTTTVSPATLSRISGLTTANQVLAVAQIPDEQSLPDAFSVKGLCLYLDDIQDPGNLGTIIRTADWFGVRQIFCSSGTADMFNPKVIQASMGSFCRVKITCEELGVVLGKTTNKPAVYGASLKGNDLFDTSYTQDAIVVIGNESRGISAATARCIDKFIRIPGIAERRDQPSNTGAESLNASVAAAIIMAWFYKLSVSV
jgi:RNA methyltransferase, TrmH family